jgi:hypothetical protein
MAEQFVAPGPIWIPSTVGYCPTGQLLHAKAFEMLEKVFSGQGMAAVGLLLLESQYDPGWARQDTAVVTVLNEVFRSKDIDALDHSYT